MCGSNLMRSICPINNFWSANISDWTIDTEYSIRETDTLVTDTTVVSATPAHIYLLWWTTLLHLLHLPCPVVVMMFPLIPVVFHTTLLTAYTYFMLFCGISKRAIVETIEALPAPRELFALPWNAYLLLDPPPLSSLINDDLQSTNETDTPELVDNDGVAQANGPEDLSNRLIVVHAPESPFSLFHELALQQVPHQPLSIEYLFDGRKLLIRLLITSIAVAIAVWNRKIRVRYLVWECGHS